MKFIALNGKGIEVASPFVADVADTISKLVRIDSDQDGSISLSEGLVAGQDLIVKVMKHYSTVAEAIGELKDTESEERKELIAVFKTAFSLDDVELEELIEDTVVFIERTASDVISLQKRWSAKLKPAA